MFCKNMISYVHMSVEGISQVNILCPTERLRFHNKWFIYSEEPVLVEGMNKRR